MKTSSNTVITLLSVFTVITLIATNPKESQLRTHMKETIKTEAKKEGGFFGAIRELFSSPEAWLKNLETKRTNYYLFSHYEVTGIDKNRNYVGVFNTFIEISR